RRDIIELEARASRDNEHAVDKRPAAFAEEFLDRPASTGSLGEALGVRAVREVDRPEHPATLPGLPRFTTGHERTPTSRARVPDGHEVGFEAAPPIENCDGWLPSKRRRRCGRRGRARSGPCVPPAIGDETNPYSAGPWGDSERAVRFKPCATCDAQ